MNCKGVDWREQANCKGVDPSLFFGNGYRQEPLRYCQNCTVTNECRTAAMEMREWGVWGGTTEKDRKALGFGPRPKTSDHFSHEDMTGMGKVHDWRGYVDNDEMDKFIQWEKEIQDFHDKRRRVLAALDIELGDET